MQVFKYSVLWRLQFHRSFSTTLSRPKTLYQTEEYAFNYLGPGPKIYAEKEFYKQLFKKNHFGSEIPLGAPSISLLTATQTLIPGRVAATKKRIGVLNKLFMRYIPEILSTSEVGSKLYGYDVEFSHVKMSSQCNFINIYWIPRGTNEDEIIQKLLEEAACPLRIELNNLKLVGSVPPIRFLKNKFHALMVEVDRRLKVADFGEGFVPTIITSNILQGQLQLQANLPDEIKRKVSKLEAGEPPDDEVDILPIRTDACGLNRNKIMKSICMSKKKDDLNHLALQNEESILGSSAIKLVSFSTEAQQLQSWDRKAFAQYMRKERFKKKKMLKELSKEFHKQVLEDTITFQDTEKEEDDLFLEFVKNAFGDIIEDFDEKLDRLHQEH